MRNTATLLAVVILGGVEAVLVSGCMGVTTNAIKPTASSDTAARPSSSSPTPTKSGLIEQDLADPSTWIIDAGGIGPVRLGYSISDVRAQLGAYEETTTDVCAVAFFHGESGPDLWLAPEYGTDIVESVVLTGNVDPEAVRAGSPRTEAGMGIGSTEDDLKAAYPNVQTSRMGSTESPGTDYFIGDQQGYINFSERDEETIDLIFVSKEPRVPAEFCG